MVIFRGNNPEQLPQKVKIKMSQAARDHVHRAELAASYPSSGHPASDRAGKDTHMLAEIAKSQQARPQDASKPVLDTLKEGSRVTYYTHDGM